MNYALSSEEEGLSIKEVQEAAANLVSQGKSSTNQKAADNGWQEEEAGITETAQAPIDFRGIIQEHYQQVYLPSVVKDKAITNVVMLHRSLKPF
tara:strand:+ start:689 stop:970 length:282 start_codon:yes stop_codon:yes gene_type:complete